MAVQLGEQEWSKAVKDSEAEGVLDRNLPDKKLTDICEKNDISFLSLSPLLQLNDHIPHEGHWNEKGHERMAEILRSLYAKYLNNDVRS